MVNHSESECVEKINEIDAEIKRLLNERRELSTQITQYYIGISYIGIDEEYTSDDCIAYYTRLGFITKFKADEWADNERKKSGVHGAEVFAVEEEEYEKYGLWRHLENLVGISDPKNNTWIKSDLDKADADFIISANAGFKKILKKNTKKFVKNPGFMHICPDECLKHLFSNN